MRLYRAHAVVLRTQPLGEADRIITMLTPERGVIRAVAKGVRRTGSRFGSRLEPFSVVDVQCYEGRNLDTVTQVSTLYPYQQLITQDYDLYTAGAVMVETSERLAENDQPNAKLYGLLVGALNALARRHHLPDLVLASYLLRVLVLSGWAPSWQHCAQCGQNIAEQAMFSRQVGGAVCSNCVAPDAVPLSLEVAQLGEALTKGQWEIVDRVDEGLANLVSTLAVDYTQWHVERRIRSVAVRMRG